MSGYLTAPVTCAYQCPNNDKCAENTEPYACPALAAWDSMPHLKACGEWDGTYPDPPAGQCVASAPTGAALRRAGDDAGIAGARVLPDGRVVKPAGSEWAFDEADMVGGSTSAIALVPGTSYAVAVDTDDAGRATLSLTAPDNITSWRLAAVGTCPQPAAGTSGIGFGEAELTVFQDFFVDPSLPYSVTRGEEFPVKVDVFNYLEAEQTVELSLGDSEGFEILGEPRVSVTVPPDHLWVMGDNRANSADSTAHLEQPGGGAVPADDVVGKVWAIVWPAGTFARCGSTSNSTMAIDGIGARKCG